MNQAVTDVFSTVRGRIQQAPTFVRHGRVASITGLIVESDGPNASVGELCLLRSQRTGFEVLAEVVGFRSEKILLMALGDVGTITTKREKKDETSYYISFWLLLESFCCCNSARCEWYLSSHRY